MLGEIVLEHPVVFALLASLLFSMMQISSKMVIEWRKKGRGEYIRLIDLIRKESSEIKKLSMSRTIVSSIIFGIFIFVMIKSADGPLANEEVEQTISSVEWGIGIVTVPFLEVILQNIKNMRVDSYVEKNEAMKGELFVSVDYTLKIDQYEWERKVVVLSILAILVDHSILWGAVVGVFAFALVSRARKVNPSMNKEKFEETKTED